jgi:4-hydroxy-3-polyprenylbenzoate decarboxylase
MRTLSAIAHSLSDNLLVRAADVALKERRPLLLAPRETPLHLGHLRSMVAAAELGAIIAPPMPAFYHRPATIEDIVDQTVNRLLDQLGIELDEELFQRWRGGHAQAPESAAALLPIDE